MNKKNIQRLLRRGKALFLAYDQGLEHGPADFNTKNVDPRFIIDLARRGKCTGIIFQKGLAEKYQIEIKKSCVPLIIKLNGKTNLVKSEPYSPQLCSVKEAIKLGAVAVGYTIYFGSEYEKRMMEEFEKIEKEAHDAGLAVILWAYPRGKSVARKNKAALMAYAARAGLELGADFVKLYFNGKEKDLAWAVKNAGRSRVIVAGGHKETEKKLYARTREVIKAGCSGVAIGRNIWQAKKPLQILGNLRKIIWSEKK
ncbi:MAG: fructose-bisphosphate aldolase [Nanoarchaeota archaeon]